MTAALTTGHYRQGAPGRPTRAAADLRLGSSLTACTWRAEISGPITREVDNAEDQARRPALLPTEWEQPPAPVTVQDDQLVRHDDGGGEDQEEEREALVDREGRRDQFGRGPFTLDIDGPPGHGRKIFVWTISVARGRSLDWATMRALVQRCSQAAVDVEGTRAAQIKAGRWCCSG